MPFKENYEYWRGQSNIEDNFRGGKLIPSPKSLQITELPPYKWTEAYKESLLKNLEKHEIEITSLRENHSVEGVRFQISAKKSELDRLDSRRGEIIKKLGLSSIITSGMLCVLFFNSERKYACIR